MAASRRIGAVAAAVRGAEGILRQFVIMLSQTGEVALFLSCAASMFSQRVAEMLTHAALQACVNSREIFSYGTVCTNHTCGSTTLKPAVSGS